MKVSKKNWEQTIFLAVLVSQLTLGQALSQDDFSTAEAEDVLNSAQIDVDGTLSRKTEADKLEEMRKRLEKQHEEMVSKKIEDMRIKEEQKLGTKLRDALSGQPIQDEVTNVSASTQKVEAPAPVVEEKTPDFKVIPSFGVKNISGEGIDLESKLNGQLSIEAMVSPRVSFGLGIGYTTLDMTDVSATSNYNSFNSNGFYNTYSGHYGQNYNYNNSFYNQGYYNSFGSQGREMTYKQWNVEMNTKFFAFDSKRIRPYLGLAVSYNRSTLNYKNNTDQAGSNYSFNGFTLGDEQFRSSYVGGSAGLGSEFYFTPNFGINLDVRYARAITTGIDNQSADTFAYNPDQAKLEQIGRDIQESDIFTLNAGVVLGF